ncbi:nitroreductase/quinone reductase family protein [Nocardia sp. NPDC051052]|uniref:nitroreductase/quinone reductase family protein n=1 Tax=Nocardia sp. NPDC051052 TaxID=3364322 RepID=UPI0037A1B97E
MTTPSPLRRARTRLVICLHRLGVPAGPTYLLTIPGRRTGRPRTTPVAPVDIDGTHYLVQAYPNANWVANARAAGYAKLTRSRRTQTVDLTEIPAAEHEPIRHEFARNRRGVAALARKGNSTASNNVAVTTTYTIFRATPHDQPHPAHGRVPTTGYRATHSIAATRAVRSVGFMRFRLRPCRPSGVPGVGTRG